MTPFLTSVPSNNVKTALFPISAFDPLTPIKKRRQVKAKPIKTLDEFRTVHMKTEDKLDRYSTSPRANYAKFERGSGET